MQRITAFIEGRNKRLDLDETLVDKDNPEILLKSPTVYWNYNNMFSTYNNFLSYDGKKSVINPGYWKFNMLAKKFESIGKITLRMNSEDGTCGIQSDKKLNLRTLGLLLRFRENTVISPNAYTES